MFPWPLCLSRSGGKSAVGRWLSLSCARRLRLDGSGRWGGADMPLLVQQEKWGLWGFRRAVGDFFVCGGYLPASWGGQWSFLPEGGELAV